jgi:hypothetical protein
VHLLLQIRACWYRTSPCGTHRRCTVRKLSAMIAPHKEDATLQGKHRETCRVQLCQQSVPIKISTRTQQAASTAAALTAKQPCQSCKSTAGNGICGCCGLIGFELVQAMQVANTRWLAAAISSHLCFCILSHTHSLGATLWLRIHCDRQADASKIRHSVWGADGPRGGINSRCRRCSSRSCSRRRCYHLSSRITGARAAVGR